MRRLIVLRPEPGATETVERARELGLEALAMPLFKVEPVAWDPPDAGGFDALLVTSANAFRQGGEALRNLRGLPVHAVGAATAAAAREAGFDIASTGEAGIDRLLSSLEPGLRLLHLCGEQRAEPDDRHKIRPIPVYRAAELPPPEGLTGAAGQTVAVHSPRAARRFADLVDDAGIDRSQIRLAAISQASGEAAGEGWDQVEAADRPGDDTLLAVAARLCEKHG